MKVGCEIVLMLVLLQLPIKSALAFQGMGEIVIPPGTRITLKLNDYLSTKSNNEGDPFSATVSDPVSIGDRLVIPKGSIVSGNISRIMRPGRFKGKAIMNLVFQSIQIPGHPPVPIVASLARMDVEGNDGPKSGGTTKSATKSEGTIEGKGSVGGDTAKVLKPGLAGAGIGALAGGGSGAAIGAGFGAAVGLATVFATRGKDLELRRGASMDISLDHSLSVPQETEGTASRQR